MRKLKGERMYMYKKKLGMLATAFLFLAGIFGISFPVSASDFHLESRESVAVVYTCMELDGGEYPFGWGTGFFVGAMGGEPMYLVTNYHVISNFVEYGSGELVGVTADGIEMQGRSKIRVYFDSRDYEEAYLISSDETKDIAILRLGTATSKRKPISLCRPTDKLVGSTVYAVGYPGLAENIFAGSTTSWGISDASVSKGTVNRIVTTEGTGRVNLQIDCAIRHGNSGGPLLNGDGAVVGVNTWSVSGDSGDADIYYAVSIDEAILLLNQSGVEYAMYSDPCGEGIESGSGNGGLVIIAVVIAALLLAGAAVFFVIRKNKEKSPQKNNTADNAVAQEPGSWQGILPGKQPASNGSQIQLIAMGGYMDGRTYSVGKDEITFGRDPLATVSFPKEVKGVSRKHCKLFWQNGILMLMDVDSSCGTYAQGGRLQPMKPVAVKSGDVFYLAEEKNSFKIQ